MEAGLLALRAPLVISTGCVLVACAGIDDGELDVRWKRDHLCAVVAHVNEQSIFGPSINRCELVEHSGTSSRKLGLRRVSDARACRIVKSEIEKLRKRTQKRDRERRARAQTRTNGQIRSDLGVKPSDLDTLACEHRRDAPRAIHPAPILLLVTQLV